MILMAQTESQCFETLAWYGISWLIALEQTTHSLEGWV